MQTSNHAQAKGVSIAELKNLARRLLPSSSALKRLILSEPDLLPAHEVHSKISMYSRLFYVETTDHDQDKTAAACPPSFVSLCQRMTESL